MTNVRAFCSCIYFSLATHVFKASSTALDRSPFFPPNLSIVLNLSSFSNSSESATLIRPTSTTIIFYCFYTIHTCQKFFCLRLMIARLRHARCLMLSVSFVCCFVINFPSTFVYPLNILCAYLFIKLLV